MNLNAVGGRKFVLAVLSLASATTLVWAGHIADGIYSAVMAVTVGAYISGNVIQKRQATATTPPTTPEAPP